MIYRSWSLLSSTVVIWGGVATAGIAGIFLFGGKVTITTLETPPHPPPPPQSPIRLLSPHPRRPCIAPACVLVGLDWRLYEAGILFMRSDGGFACRDHYQP
ncbi:hypothetical protein HU200_015018 [Digitaria exilis]|uniref:Uncharacterized protein n=1 Tax=Digitaria exilis TaxID=1010633 RepID=A0A835KJC1_9POAL|nr:hypothetical protein HU200_015018 [Digitaria exilis]